MDMDNEKTKNRLSDDIDVVNIGQYFEKSVVVAELKNRSEIRIREILIYSLLILSPSPLIKDLPLPFCRKHRLFSVSYLSLY
jgi:hypothetical protein